MDSCWAGLGSVRRFNPSVRLDSDSSSACRGNRRNSDRSDKWETVLEEPLTTLSGGIGL